MNWASVVMLSYIHMRPSSTWGVISLSWSVLFPPMTQQVKNPPPKQEMQETRVQSLGWEDPWKRKWQPTPGFLLGESLRQRSLVGYSPWGCKESDTTEQMSTGTKNITIYSTWISVMNSPYSPYSPSLLTLTKLPWWLSGKEPACQCGRCGFSPWFGKEEWRPAPVSLPGKCRGQGSPAGWAIEQGSAPTSPDKHRRTVCSTCKQHCACLFVSLAAVV